MVVHELASEFMTVHEQTRFMNSWTLMKVSFVFYRECSGDMQQVTFTHSGSASQTMAHRSANVALWFNGWILIVTVPSKYSMFTQCWYRQWANIVPALCLVFARLGSTGRAKVCRQPIWKTSVQSTAYGLRLWSMVILPCTPPIVLIPVYIGLYVGLKKNRPAGAKKSRRAIFVYRCIADT